MSQIFTWPTLWGRQCMHGWQFFHIPVWNFGKCLKNVRPVVRFDMLIQLQGARPSLTIGHARGSSRSCVWHLDSIPHVFLYHWKPANISLVGKSNQRDFIKMKVCCWKTTCDVFGCKTATPRKKNKHKQQTHTKTKKVKGGGHRSCTRPRIIRRHLFLTDQPAGVFWLPLC